MTESKTISDLKLGQSAEVLSLGNNTASLKLLEMGVLPGSKITMMGSAPFGDPIKILIGDDFMLSLRKAEAKNIILK